MTAPTPIQVVLRIIVIIALAELLIMLVLGEFEGKLGFYSEALVDTVMLVILSAPAIFFWIINPFIQAHQAALNHISHLAHTDYLTQISNRRQLLQLLQMTIASCRRHSYYGAVLLIDLNRFKPINDTYGHDTGDAVLVEIAARLTSQVREEDTVGRLGGDEFIIILSQLGSDENIAINELGRITQRMIAALKEPMEVAEYCLKVTSSIGIRLLDSEAPDVETVIRQADEAMYMAKQTNQDFPVSFYQD